MHTKQSQKDIENEVVSYLRAAGELSAFGASVPGLCYYFSELSSWNRRLNLTGLKTTEKMIAKHLGDTLVLVRWIPEGLNSVIDIGTGAGIPGLILKILRPDLDVCLLDARRKRVSFLMSVIAGLGLANVWAVHGRAGEGNAPLPASCSMSAFDMAVSQAVGKVTDLVSMSEGYLSTDGMVVAMKGADGIRELEEYRGSLSGLGWEAEAVESFTPVEKLRRYLVVMRPVS